VEITAFKVPDGTYASGRREPVWLGVVHFVSAANVPGYAQDPYNLEVIKQEIFFKLAQQHQFSCHDMISRGGKVVQMVAISDTAYHAGKSVIGIPKYKKGLNNCSYGVELVGKAGDKYTDEQYTQLAKLAAKREEEVLAQGLGKIVHWVGHDWISGTLAYRLGIREYNAIKVDPGPTFDWGKFQEMLWREKLEWGIREEARKEFEASFRPPTTDNFTAGTLLAGLLKRVLKRK